MNLGLPLWEERGLGVQIGTAADYSDFAVGVVEAIEGTGERFQSFTTIGLFQRTTGGWKWGVGYDYLAENYYEGINLAQWRGLVGKSIGSNDEFGVWFTVPDHDDTATFLTTPVFLDPIAMVNGYWRHTWQSGVETTLWLGGAESHGQEIILLPAAAATGTQFVYGADIHVPLNDYMAIYGEANFITPSDSGTVDAYLGMVIYPGGSERARSKCYAPVLPVAGNPTFAVDLRR